MAQRPFYFVKNNNVYEEMIQNFKWFSGFNIIQKQKCIQSLHDEIIKLHYTPLEISTKSTIELGKKLSAFNLKLNDNYLENIFQSSKVFENGGPFIDLLNVQPKEAKHDERLHNSGKLVAFRLDGVDWPLEPKTVFYDWIYFNAVKSSLTNDDLNELKKYDAFTDIEFNPEKSINTQARTVALILLMLQMFGELPNMTAYEFLKFHKEYVKYSI